MNHQQKKLTFTAARWEQLSQGGCGCIASRRSRLTSRSASPPQPPWLLFVLASDLCHSHWLHDREAVSHSDRWKHLVWVRWETQREARCLVVCALCLMEASSLVPKALNPHSGGSVCDDSGCDADGCAVTVLVARERVHKSYGWGGWLVNTACVYNWIGWFRIGLMFKQQAAQCLVFTTSLVWPGLEWLAVRWWLWHTHRGQSRLVKDCFSDWKITDSFFKWLIL